MILQVVINQTRFHVMSHAGESMQYRWKAETLCASGAHWQQAFRRFGQHKSCFSQGRDVAWSKTVSLIFLKIFWDPKHPQIQMVGYQLNDARDDKTTPLFPSKRFQKSSVFFLGCEKGGPPCSIAGKLQVLQGVESERNVNRGEGNCNVASDSRKEKFDRGLRRGSDSP